MAYPAHFERSIGEVVDLDILTGQLVGQVTPLRDDLAAVMGQTELLAHMTLFAVAHFYPALISHIRRKTYYQTFLDD